MTRRLGSRYELQEQIGGGGMAVVYKAVDTLLDRTVAVKMLRPQYSGDEEFVTRFRQEAQSAARLSHPNIVNLYDIGMAGNEYYIVMEYVDGPTLKDVIRDRGPLSARETVDIAIQICDALQHAHEHNIIHRDIKPANILLTKSGRVKVTDFGIARAVSGNTITHQHAKSVLGSVHYFSPEQARGATADVKSDIYSLGVVLYEMLTHQLPFSGDSPVSVALKHLRDRFVEPRQIQPNIPQSLENIVLRCLVKAPDARYPDMRTVKADLEDALLHPDKPKFVMPEEVPDATIAVPVFGFGTGDGESADGLSDAQQPGRRRWWMALLWTGVALGVLCVGAFAAYYIVMDLYQTPNVTLPNVVGIPVTQAVTRLERAGFAEKQIHIQKAYNDTSKKGYVYSEDPPGNLAVKQTRDIYLYVSKGPAQIPIPNLQNVPIDQARQQLVNLGFSPNNIYEQQVTSDQFDKDMVVDSNPPAGDQVPPDAKITLYVSSGPQNMVPDVIGLTLKEAEQEIVQSQLKVGQVYYVPSTSQPNLVFKVGPFKIGQQVPAGTPIDLYVAVDSGGTDANGTGTPTDNSIGNTTDYGSTGNSIDNGTGAGASQTAAGNAGGPFEVGSNPPANLPSNANVRPVEVTVLDPDGSRKNVMIVKTDAEGQGKQVVNTYITTKTTWVIYVYLLPNTAGEVQVYVNGEKVRDQPISY